MNLYLSAAQQVILTNMSFMDSLLGLSKQQVCDEFAKARDANPDHIYMTLVEFVKALMESSDFIDENNWPIWEPIFHAYDVAATLRNDIAELTLDI